MNHQAIERAAERYLAAEQHRTFRDEVAALLEARDWDELEDRFYRDLEFGTGGLRGVIGGGFNRINPFVVARATTGLARYVATHGSAGSDGTKRAVIAHDSRRYSREFAEIAARVFAAHGIKAYLFDALRPTPELSFALRELGATVGCVVTASHNPPEYNGFKVYWDDGSQVVAPHDRAIIARVLEVEPEAIRMVEFESAVREGAIEIIDPAMDTAFVAMVKRQLVEPALLERAGGEVTAVYTPLHGTGAPLVERALGELGVTVHTVPEQREPDGEFPTVALPNPEEAGALEAALELGRAKGADIVLATDPDADRLGIAVPDGSDFTLLTGNQLGVLLVDYVLGRRAELGTLPPDPVFVTTIVTTPMQRAVAEARGARVYETLTGFKHIAAVMRRLETERGTYVIGDEESYGYLIGTEVRDKDAITATVLTVEMALHLRQAGATLLDRLAQLWREFGYYQEETLSRYFKGPNGQTVMDAMMQHLREQPPREFGGLAVTRVVDYLSDTQTEPADGGVSPGPGLPRSNVLRYDLADGARVSARPSGTEPKIKFYLTCRERPSENLDAARRTVHARIAAIERDVIAIIEAAESA